MMTTMTTTTILEKLLSEPFPLVLQSARRRSRAIFIVKELDAMGIAVRGGDLALLPVLKRMRVTAAVRASSYAYTSAEEIDQLIAALQRDRGGLS
jgi:selenocysteine lyase/cysteine desulfurase